METGKRIKVKQKDPPVSKTVLAEAIVNIGKAARELSESGLNEKAIIVLLNNKTGVPQTQIKTVLNGLKQLEAWYCK